MRYFHLLADKKTVKEIDWEKYRELVNQGWDHQRKFLLITVLKSGINIVHGKNTVFVPLRQLLHILQLSDVITEKETEE